MNIDRDSLLRLAAEPAATRHPVETRVLHQFSFQVHDLPGGGRQVDVVTPDGRVLALPFDATASRQLAARLAAGPSPADLN